MRWREIVGQEKGIQYRYVRADTTVPQERKGEREREREMKRRRERQRQKDRELLLWVQVCGFLLPEAM